MIETFNHHINTREGSSVTVRAESGRCDLIEVNLSREEANFCIHISDPKDAFLIAEAIKNAAQSLLAPRS